MKKIIEDLLRGRFNNLYVNLYSSEDFKELSGFAGLYGNIDLEYIDEPSIRYPSYCHFCGSSQRYSPIKIKIFPGTNSNYWNISDFKEFVEREEAREKIISKFIIDSLIEDINNNVSLPKVNIIKIYTGGRRERYDLVPEIQELLHIDDYSGIRKNVRKCFWSGIEYVMIGKGLSLSISERDIELSKEESLVYYEQLIQRRDLVYDGLEFLAKKVFVFTDDNVEYRYFLDLVRYFGYSVDLDYYSIPKEYFKGGNIIKARIDKANKSLVIRKGNLSSLDTSRDSNIVINNLWALDSINYPILFNDFAKLRKQEREDSTFDKYILNLTGNEVIDRIIRASVLYHFKNLKLSGREIDLKSDSLGDWSFFSVSEDLGEIRVSNNYDDEARDPDFLSNLLDLTYSDPSILEEFLRVYGGRVKIACILENDMVLVERENFPYEQESRPYIKLDELFVKDSFENYVTLEYLVYSSCYKESDIMIKFSNEKELDEFANDYLMCRIPLHNTFSDKGSVFMVHNNKFLGRYIVEKKEVESQYTFQEIKGVIQDFIQNKYSKEILNSIIDHGYFGASFFINGSKRLFESFHLEKEDLDNGWILERSGKSVSLKLDLLSYPNNMILLSNFNQFASESIEKSFRSEGSVSPVSLNEKLSEMRELVTLFTSNNSYKILDAIFWKRSGFREIIDSHTGILSKGCVVCFKEFRNLKFFNNVFKELGFLEDSDYKYRNILSKKETGSEVVVNLTARDEINIFKDLLKESERVDVDKERSKKGVDSTIAMAYLLSTTNKD